VVAALLLQRTSEALTSVLPNAHAFFSSELLGDHIPLRLLKRTDELKQTSPNTTKAMFRSLIVQIAAQRTKHGSKFHELIGCQCLSTFQLFPPPGHFVGHTIVATQSFTPKSADFPDCIMRAAERRQALCQQEEMRLWQVGEPSPCFRCHRFQETDRLPTTTAFAVAKRRGALFGDACACCKR